MSTKDQLLKVFEQATETEIQAIAEYVTFLKFRDFARITFSSPAESLAISKNTETTLPALHSRDLQLWADEVVNLMSEALFLTHADLPFTDEQILEKKFQVRCRLSALADRGKWFLPNRHSDKFGQEKEFAYRGYRHPALDCIINVFRSIDLVHDTANEKECGEKILAAKRQFVSEIQQILNP